MRRSVFPAVFAGALVALTGAACSNNDTTTTPTTPSPTATTETFTGTLTVNGAITFPFFPTAAGSANATLTAMDPDLAVTVKDGGHGAFVAGETVYQGPSLGESSITAVVYGWNPATRVLLLKNITGTFTIDTPIVGADSGAAWDAGAIDTPVIGLALGTWSGTTCTIVLANDISAVGSMVTGVVQGSGSLCARVYDVGHITAPATFSIDVTHF